MERSEPWKIPLAQKLGGAGNESGIASCSIGNAAVQATGLAVVFRYRRHPEGESGQRASRRARSLSSSPKGARLGRRRWEDCLVVAATDFTRKEIMDDSYPADHLARCACACSVSDDAPANGASRAGHFCCGRREGGSSLSREQLWRRFAPDAQEIPAGPGAVASIPSRNGPGLYC